MEGMSKSIDSLNLYSDLVPKALAVYQCLAVAFYNQKSHIQLKT